MRNLGCYGECFGYGDRRAPLQYREPPFVDMFPEVKHLSAAFPTNFHCLLTPDR